VNTSVSAGFGRLFFLCADPHRVRAHQAGEDRTREAAGTLRDASRPVSIIGLCWM